MMDTSTIIFVYPHTLEFDGVSKRKKLITGVIVVGLLVLFGLSPFAVLFLIGFLGGSG